MPSDHETNSANSRGRESCAPDVTHWDV
jgi:hypothetical protein